MTNAVTIAKLLWALSQIESGGNDHAHGQHGELGRYQPMASVWRAATNAPFSCATNPATASAVVLKVVAERTGKDPATVTPEAFAMAWHAPYGKMNAERRDYVARFVNLVNKGK